MGRVICCLLIALCFSGCSNRTEFGRKRPLKLSSHNDPVDPVVFTLIDTAAVYERINVFTERNPEPTYKYAKAYLKFYGNGRVGDFAMYNISEAFKDVKLLNPGRADVGYYKYKDAEKGLEIRTLFEHVQGGGFIKHRLVKSSNDTLTFSYDNRQLTQYKKIKLPEKLLIYKPDW